MDVQILEWVVQKPEDWWLSTRSTVYTWGKGSWHQLGHSTRERVLPTAVEEWQDVRQVREGGREGGKEGRREREGGWEGGTENWYEGGREREIVRKEWREGGRGRIEGVRE